MARAEKNKKKVSRKSRKTSGKVAAASNPLSPVSSMPKTTVGRGTNSIPSPQPGVFAGRLVILIVMVLLGVGLLKIVKPFNFTKKSVSAPAPAPAVNNEVSKALTERRMTETFTFDGVSTKWGYAGWTRDGSANPQRDKGIETLGELGIAGVPYKSGIGTHAPSEIVFDLKGKVKSFSCKAGVDRGGNERSAIIFSVYGDGKKLFQSPVMKVKDRAVPVRLNVSGMKELNLKVDALDPSVGWTHADWVEIKFE